MIEFYITSIAHSRLDLLHNSCKKSFMDQRNLLFGRNVVLSDLLHELLHNLNDFLHEYLPIMK